MEHLLEPESQCSPVISRSRSVQSVASRSSSQCSFSDDCQTREPSRSLLQCKRPSLSLDQFSPEPPQCPHRSALSFPVHGSARRTLELLRPSPLVRYWSRRAQRSVRKVLSHALLVQRQSLWPWEAVRSWFSQPRLLLRLTRRQLHGQFRGHLRVSQSVKCSLQVWSVFVRVSRVDWVNREWKGLHKWKGVTVPPIVPTRGCLQRIQKLSERRPRYVE